MPQSGIQFHASPDDIGDILRILKDIDANLYFYVWTHSRGARNFTDASDAVLYPSSSLIASERPIDKELSFGFLDARALGALVIRLPVLTSEGLREVSAAAMSYEKEDLKIWEKFIRKFRKTLKSGAVLRTDGVGSGEFYKNAHATERAIALSEKGVLLRALAGNLTYHF
jgi:hypothetical protein